MQVLLTGAVLAPGKRTGTAILRINPRIVGVGGAVPLAEQLATADDLQGFVCGHMPWSDGEPGPAIELESTDFTTVDWDVVLKAMHAAL